MGKSSSKFFDEIARSVYNNDLSAFAGLLHLLKSINSPLEISAQVCVDLKIPEDWNPSTLHLVCYLDKPDFLTFLIEVFEDLEIINQDSFGYTALMIAVKHRKEKIVEMLLSEGVMVKNQYDSGDTALHYACEGGDMRIALHLISNCTNLDVVNQEGMTPLMYAVQKKHFKLAQTLVNMGADPFIPDNNQFTSVDWGKKVGWSEEELESIKKDMWSLDQGVKQMRSESNGESFITITDRSVVGEQEVLEKPNFLVKGLWKVFDFVVTDQISWNK